jgi:hypothetical protein
MKWVKRISVEMNINRTITMAAMLLFGATPSPFAAGQDGAAVLRALAAMDTKLVTVGVTLEGMKVTLPVKIAFPVRENRRRAGPAARFKWKFTCVSTNKIAYDKEVVEVLRWEDWLPPGSSIPQPSDEPAWMYGRLLSFISPEATGFYNLMGPLKPGLWSTQQKQARDKVSGAINLYPPNPLTLSAYLDLPLLLVGRGYAKHLESISSVEALADGRLSVKAEGKPFYTRATKWDLVIEPAAAYLVRSATYYVDDSDRTIAKPRYVITTSGVKWFGSLAAPERFEQRDPFLDKEQPYLESGTVISASLKGDEQFFKETVETLKGPFPISTSISDHRVDPPLHLTVPAGETLDGDFRRPTNQMWPTRR